MDAARAALTVTRAAAPALIAAAAAVGAAGWTEWQAAAVTSRGFPLDDAWIHLQFARHVALGQGLAFNDGITSSGSTAPLWSALLAIPFLLGVDPVAGTKVAGAFFVCVAAAASACLAVEATGRQWPGLVAGLSVGLSSRFAWAALSGMEVPLYAALSTLSLLAYLRALRGAPSLWWGVLAGLSGCARPETFVTGLVLAAHWLWRGAVTHAGTRPRWWWAGPAAFLAGGLGFVLVNYLTGGAPLPATFYAKTGVEAAVAPSLAAAALASARSALDFANTLLLWTSGQSSFLFLTFLPGVLLLCGLRTGASKTGHGVIVAVFFLTPIAKGLVAPVPPLLTHDGRYIAHLLAIYFVITACGLAAIASWVRARWVVALIAVVAIARICSQMALQAPVFAAHVRNINHVQVAAAAWLARHTSPDARVAANDIGAIGFLSRRFIIDTEGLVTPGAADARRRRQLDVFLAEARPDVVVIYPEWYPYLSTRTDLLQEVARVSAPRVIAGGESLVIYKTAWTRPGRLNY